MSTRGAIELRRTILTAHVVAFTKLQSTADAYTVARKAYSDAFQDEVALRSEHYQAIDQLMGLVRATFPNDRTQQDLVFPVVETAEETPDDDSDATAAISSMP